MAAGLGAMGRAASAILLNGAEGNKEAHGYYAAMDEKRNVAVKKAASFITGITVHTFKKIGAH